eukprot:1159067-Pelagomonas_calceolata.AAC.15
MHFVCGEWRWLPDLKMPCLWLPTLAVVTRDATPAAGAAPGCSSRVRLAFQTLMESAAGDPVICLAFHTQMQPVAGGPVEIVVACFICFGDLQSGMDSQQRLKLSLEPNVAWIPQNPGRSQLVESPLCSSHTLEIDMLDAASLNGTLPLLFHNVCKERPSSGRQPPEAL